MTSSIFAGLRSLLPANFVAASSSEARIVERRKNLSFAGVLSRAFSTPSVSGPPFNGSAHHIDSVLVKRGQISTRRCKPVAATCSSRALTLRHNGSYQHATMSALRNRDTPNNKVIYGYIVCEAVKRWYGLNPLLISDSWELRRSSTNLSLCRARDAAFDDSSREEQMFNFAHHSANLKDVAPGKTLTLVSASCYLPHPDKEATGGEDAHFICDGEQAIGVADGVGGWAAHGVDSGLYSRELMSNAARFVQKEPEGCVDPARVLEKAHCVTKSRGSSTACIIALNDQDIHAVNVGDSGFMIVQEGCTVFRSPAQQHGFNFPYQLECGFNGDLPSGPRSVVFKVAVAAGDVIITATDGLFDNLYDDEITAAVVQAVQAGLGLQAMAQELAALAQLRARDKDRHTPFSTAAYYAGYLYCGGKLDDTTVVVSYIASSK